MKIARLASAAFCVACCGLVAGAENLDPDSTWQEIMDAYADQGWPEWAQIDGLDSDDFQGFHVTGLDHVSADMASATTLAVGAVIIGPIWIYCDLAEGV